MVIRLSFAVTQPSLEALLANIATTRRRGRQCVVAMSAL
jgi:hypothetical protein